MLTQQAMTPTHSAQRSSQIAYPSLLTLIALLAAYALLPWAVHKTAALTGNAYDLAEWMSIHPAVRAETLMLTPLLLRLPLVCIAWWAALGKVRSNVGAGNTSVRAGYIPPIPRIIIVVLIAIALLPPFEFLTSARGDPNYQQQALLSALALIGGLALVWMHSAWAHHAARLRITQAISLFIGAGAGTWGTVNALGYWRDLDVTVSIGAGLVVFVALALIAAWIGLHTTAES